MYGIDRPQLAVGGRGHRLRSKSPKTWDRWVVPEAGIEPA